MFQYTTETIINSNEGSLSGGKRFIALQNDGKTEATTTNGIQILIDGVGLYQKGYIQNVTKRSYSPAVKETVAVTIPTTNINNGDVIRLKIASSQEGLVSSIYADAQLKHKKPFFYEVKVVNKNNIAVEFAAIINKEMALTDFNFFKASGSTNVLTLTADDCYTRFEEINVAKVPVTNITTSNLGSVLTGWEDYDPIFAWVRKDGTIAGTITLTKGSEGAGTVARLIKNLRVPTDANTDPFAADNGGRPIPGGKYTQFVFEYVTDRKHIGGQVVGALDKSITTHVFFIEDAIKDTFKDLFDKCGITVNSADPGAAATTTAPKPGSKQ